MTICLLTITVRACPLECPGHHKDPGQGACTRRHSLGHNLKKWTENQAELALPNQALVNHVHEVILDISSYGYEFLWFLLVNDWRCEGFYSKSSDLRWSAFQKAILTRRIMSFLPGIDGSSSAGLQPLHVPGSWEACILFSLSICRIF